MASDDLCIHSLLAKKLLAEFRTTGSIDTSQYPVADPQILKKVATSKSELCVIRDTTNALIHSYSIVLYKNSEDMNYYLVYEGGFDGSDIYGYGPIEKISNKQ